MFQTSHFIKSRPGTLHLYSRKGIGVQPSTTVLYHSHPYTAKPWSTSIIYEPTYNTVSESAAAQKHSLYFPSTKSVDVGEQVDCILLDFSKASDNTGASLRRQGAFTRLDIQLSPRTQPTIKWY
jgi:hypothetical protein